jgi:protein-S-isoprenylcysteine O-methyltransferase Ste14
VVAWLFVFLIAVVAFVKGYEEPRLAEQFGESYERYRRAVPGWWPRLTPYRG